MITSNHRSRIWLYSQPRR